MGGSVVVTREQYFSNIFIFQMGRVGSLAIKKSLINSGLTPIHVHYLYTPMEPGHGNPKDKEYVDNHLKEPRKIITLTRDPIQRTISSVVRQIPNVRFDLLDPIEISQYIIDNEYWKWGDMWWTTQLKRFLGEDPLDIMRVLKLNNYKNVVSHTKKGLLLVLRNENIHECDNILSTFVGRKVNVIRFNETGNNEAGRKAYLDFIDRIRFPKEIVDKVYHSRYARAAYSEKEIELFKEKWSA